MKIDIHTHIQLSRDLPFSEEFTRNQLQAASQARLNAVCLTEQYGFEGMEQLYRFLSDTCTREGDCLVTEDGLKIFPGLEVDSSDGGHVLMIGSPEAILELYRSLRDESGELLRLPVSKLAEMVNHDTMLMGLAHPYRDNSNPYHLRKHDLLKFDFIELNAADLAENRADVKRRSKNLANGLNRPLLAGSDTYQALQFGCVWNTFEKDFSTISEFRQEMEAGRFERFAALNFQAQVQSAALARRAMEDSLRNGCEAIPEKKIV